MDDFIKNGIMISQIKVDLMTIAIAPEHHDICLKDIKKPHPIIGRISFNIACSHIDFISLNIKHLRIRVDHLVQNEVSLKLKFKDFHTSIETQETLPIQPQLYNKERETLYNWIESSGELSISQILLSMTELRSSCVSINIFDTVFVEDKKTAGTSNKNLFNPNNDSIRGKKIIKRNLKDDMESESINLVAKMSLIGYANIDFYKVLSENDNTILKQSSKFFQKYSRLYGGDSNNNLANLQIPTTQINQLDSLIKFKLFDDVNTTFSEEIYFNGNLIGNMEGGIEVKGVPQIRQIMCGVHTENGFDISSVYLNLNASNSLSHSTTASYKAESVPAELKVLGTQINTLLSQFVAMTNLRQLTQEARDNNNQILITMNDIKQNLQKSCKESCLYYNYSNDKDLFTAQKMMLDLALNLLNLIENLSLDQRGIAFEVLILLCNRAEFYLGTMTLYLFNNKSSQCTVKIVENFIVFLNRALNFVLDRLAVGKNNDKEAKKFVEFFLSVAYFRIPKFRLAFLEVIGKNIDLINGQITDHFENVDISSNPIISLIDWENLFYKKLSIHYAGHDLEDINEKLQETDKILEKPDWQDRLSKRGLAFFSMIIRLEEYVQNKIVVSRNIKWCNIPGFDIIIKAVKHELGNREVSKYPSQLLDLMAIFINDSDVINSFFSIIIKKT
jgi:hypothetical protein